MSKFFQRLTKLHEPVGWVQFVVLEKIYKCLFIPNCTRKTMWLRIHNIHENYEIAYYNYTEAKRALQKWFIQTLQVTLCVRLKQPLTIKTKIYNAIFISFRRKKVQSQAKQFKELFSLVFVTSLPRINLLLHWITWKLHLS